MKKFSIIIGGSLLVAFSAQANFLSSLTGTSGLNANSFSSVLSSQSVQNYLNHKLGVNLTADQYNKAGAVGLKVISAELVTLCKTQPRKNSACKCDLSSPADFKAGLQGCNLEPMKHAVKTAIIGVKNATTPMKPMK